MKIFISWSGERSQKIAELFKDWIQCVIQAAKPWISSHDVDRGALWYTEISKTLADSQFGILCIIGKTKCDGIQNQMRLFGGRVSPKRKATKISHTHTKKHRSNGF